MADGADPQAFVNAATAPTLPLADIQGLVLRGYKYYTIRHFIFKICDVDGARALCAKLQPQCGAELSVTTAEQWTAHPPYCLNISVTNSGLKLLIGEANYKKVYDRSFTIFSSFDTGADSPATAETVGDVGPSD
ncbi:MAG TPA: hypothetical protein VEA60_05600, partial [Allosphingosinicella sp.]|nr:hypothetical protein [Allosphingosinicella sp.]